MADILDQWDMATVQPLVKSEKVVNLEELIGILPTTIMLNILFGCEFVNNHLEELYQLAREANDIMMEVIGNSLASTFFYEYLDTKTNRTLKGFKQRWGAILKKYESSEERQQVKFSHCP